MSWQIQIGLVSLIPLVVSVILHFVFKKTKLSYWQKQIIAGVLFGGIAILGTEFSIPIEGANINARDAAPLCAALIFGAPAGIISGFIGGVERWFSVYWGVGAFTRLACSISTFITGCFGAILKKKMFEDKLPHWRHALIIGAVAETIHMMMVFVTNLEESKKAFAVVKACTIPMISANALSVALAVLAINILDKESNFDRKGKETLSQQFLKGTLIVVLLALVSTSLFTLSLQNSISETQTYDLLKLNILDIKDDVDARADKNLLDICYKVKEEISGKEITNEYLINLAEQYDVAEIDIVDENGILVNCSRVILVGYDMASGEQSKEFLCLLNDETEYVQSYQATSSNTSVYRKYAGVSLESGFLQVGLNAEQFQEELASEVAEIATYKHIGENGGIMILDSQLDVVSDNLGYVGVNIYDAYPRFNVFEHNEYEIEQFNLSGIDYYYMYAKAQGYTIIAFIPIEDADFNEGLSVYLNIFMQTIVFAALFILIFFLTKHLVVDNVKGIDDSLQAITNGNLQTVVDYRSNEEFDSLSTNINITVEAMKQLIADANKRIDDELQYAKDIQSSSLPSVFPPFPDRDEFDICATMDPAKEVGGDFYDFYMLDSHTIAFLIADVAGKGIPAALFMMRAKTILKTYAMGDIAVADIFTNANYNLCEGNEAGMFVTAWMGFLDLATGTLKYANAGHNRPLLRRKDGNYEYLKGPAGFVLAGMEGIVYKQQEIRLEPGDEIFLYTDGVTEATDANKKLYGDDRLQTCINIHKDEDSQTMIKNVKADVDKFYEGAQQFDDITMLSLKYANKFTYGNVDKSK